MEITDIIFANNDEKQANVGALLDRLILHVLYYDLIFTSNLYI
jgi:hypothetical protein